MRICVYTLTYIKLHSLVAQMVKNLPAMQETWFQSLGQEGPLEEKMETQFSTLGWRTAWTEEPGRLVHSVTESDMTERHMPTHTKRYDLETLKTQK